MKIKNVFIVTGLSSLTLYLGYGLFFKNQNQKTFAPPQIESQDSKSNKIRSTNDKAAITTEADAVNFAPAKETLLINNALSSSAVALNNDTKETLKPQSANYGLTEGVDPKANAQVASVAEALKNTKFPERLSPLIQPKAFDRIQFEKDPQAYLNVIEPGRVFQSKNPDQTAIVIQRISEPFVIIQQNDKTVLKVKALPLMPVTFTSFDLGAFQNKLTSITVQADKDGFAQATFIGTEGTLADCNILASCPETTSDGSCPCNFHLVYLVVDPGKDYHWYRLDSTGFWSQKHGSKPVDDVDASGNPISDPSKANHNYGIGTNYQNCGYLCARNQ